MNISTRMSLGPLIGNILNIINSVADLKVTIWLHAKTKFRSQGGGQGYKALMKTKIHDWNYGKIGHHCVSFLPLTYLASEMNKPTRLETVFVIPSVRRRLSNDFLSELELAIHVNRSLCPALNQARLEHLKSKFILAVGAGMSPWSGAKYPAAHGLHSTAPVESTRYMYL